MAYGINYERLAALNRNYRAHGGSMTTMTLAATVTPVAGGSSPAWSLRLAHLRFSEKQSPRTK